MEKDNFYQGVKVIGLVTFIPLMLASGPLSGYFIGSYLQKKFNLGAYWVFIFVAIGFFVAFAEVIKILKAIVKINRK